MTGDKKMQVELKRVSVENAEALWESKKDFTYFRNA